MTKSKFFTSSLPLNDDRDVLARVGLRCMYCTLPYMLFVFCYAALGHSEGLTSPWTAYIAAIPPVGGLIDYLRLRRRSARLAAA